MFLKTLTLKGFKSFADTVALDLEPGLTVVVGPNGSGKSNIVDAVAWVLGAQGPRALRSQKMEDVIFAGNGRRPALGRAEVSLTIDNSAGLLPIGFSEVTITRTLFRTSGESEYAINGVPCRLLDVQELLSDTGVGRQQHVIVSQGNLDQVLDVRAEDRRLVIEEAAGILKFRRRKEKAQRRLEATEGHFVRLSDLLKELRRQMKPLERQAEAARRHGGLAAELRALKLHLAGRSLASLLAGAQRAAQARAAGADEEASLLGRIRSLDEEVAGLERRLDAVDERGLDAVAAAMGALRERGRGLAAVLAERARALAAEVAAAEGGGDPGERLEADAATLAADLAAVEEEQARLAASSQALAEAEAELGERRRRLAVREQDEARARRAAEARGELAALQAAAERGRAEVADLASRVSALDAAAGEATARLDAQRAAGAEAERQEAAAEAALAGAASELHDAERGLAAAVAARQAAERRGDAAAARVEALALAVGAPAAPPAAALGSLLELIEIDPGWEAAVEAALDEALGGVVVAGVDAARTLLAEGGPAVLVAGDPERVMEHRHGDLRRAVRSAPALAGLLDRLLASTVAVDGGWEAALDLAAARPELTVVTRAGDRFAPTGWRVRSAGRPSVATALAEARRRSDAAAAETAAALAGEAGARGRRDAAAAVHAERQAEWDRCRQAVAEARAAVAHAEAELRQAQAAAVTARAHAAATATRLADDHRRAQNLDAQLALPVETGLPAAPPGDLDAERDDVAWESQELAARRAQIATRSEGLAQRRDDLARRLTDTRARLDEARARRSHAAARAERGRTDLRHTRALAGAVSAAQARVDAHLVDLQARRHRRGAAARELGVRLDQVRRLRQHAEHELEEARARVRRAELEEAETRLRLEAATESVRRELDCEPAAAIGAGCPPLPAGTSPPTRVREVERELRLLGPVNPLAMEELASLEERHAFLAGQLEDVRTTRRDLTRVIRSVEAEMTTLLAAACADVAENFAALFETLFPGGEGRIRLTDPDHILESGIEIEARPGGKSPRKLSLLSGGERSLCALAFLFAVFRSRPSPFYLLDEVEAALDDVNLHRFLRLLGEFREEAQLVVVSHQKRTMEAADCLFGVTMQPGGSSRVLSERVDA